jgi:hypothetical protein
MCEELQNYGRVLCDLKTASDAKVEKCVESEGSCGKIIWTF